MTDTLARASGSPAAVRWLPTEPFAHLDDIHRRTNQAMRTAVHQLTTPAPWEWSPAVDIEETDAEFVIEIDLPGATAHGLILQWNDRFLTVHGHIPTREHLGVLHGHARHTGPLHHTIALPGPVLGTKITANLTAGVLTIHAPKAHPGAARRIHIVDPDSPESPGGWQP